MKMSKVRLWPSLAFTNSVDYETVGEFIPRVNFGANEPYPDQDIFFGGVFEARYIRIVRNDCQNVRSSGQVVD